MAKKFFHFGGVSTFRRLNPGENLGIRRVLSVIK